MRKFCKILNIFLVVIILLAVSGGVANAQRVKFEKVKIPLPPDITSPVRLNDNEIYFLGGRTSQNWRIFYTVKVYKIKEHKFVDLYSMMNVARYKYGSIPYDENHILVLGGKCMWGENCSSIAEIYDKRTNKFTRISNSNNEYPWGGVHFLLENGEVLLYNGLEFEKFNPTTQKFTVLMGKDNQPLETDDYIPAKRMQLVGKDKVLIYSYGFMRYGEAAVLNLKTLEIMDIPGSDLFEDAYVPAPVLIDDDTLLFVGVGYNGKRVVSLRISDGTYHDYGEVLKKQINGLDSLLLDNNRMLLAYGVLNTPEFLWGYGIEHVIYDYKYNKITQRKVFVEWGTEAYGTRYAYVFKINNSKILYLMRY